MGFNKPTVFIFTMTQALGDYLIMGDLVNKITRLIPNSLCMLIHRDNPHVSLWPYDGNHVRFYNVFHAGQMLSCINQLTHLRRKGYCVFGLQMSPGSLQGYSLYRLFKGVGALDYIVDFNLINADIITPARGAYILERHLNQVQDLTKVPIPQDYYQLYLPIKRKSSHVDRVPRLIGIHPFCRLSGHAMYGWPVEDWALLVEKLLLLGPYELVIFGKDRFFNDFKDDLLIKVPTSLQQRLKFKEVCDVSDLIDTVDAFEFIISVNTAVVHIARALNIKTVVLSGPALSLWNPHGEQVRVVKDREAAFQPNDRPSDDDNFPSVSRIKLEDVMEAFKALAQ